MKKVSTILGFLFLLLIPAIAPAQNWSNAGNSFVCPYGVNTLIEYNGQIYAGGVSQITRWNGTNWSQVATVQTIGTDVIWSMAVYNGELYVSGEFSSLANVAATNIIKYNGISWSPVGNGLTAQAAAMREYNGELYAVGYNSLAIYGGASMAKWNGTSWSPVGMNSNIAGSAYDMLVHNNELYVCGLFSNIGGVAATNIAKYNGTGWSALGQGINYYTHSLAVYNNELVAGGYFTGAGGIPANSVAKWNGTSWSTLGNGITGNGQGGSGPEINALAVYNGGLYAGGEFAMAGTVPAYNLAMWDGYTWYDIGGTYGGGVCGGVYGLGVFQDALFVGGLYDTAGTIPAFNIAIYNGPNVSGITERQNATVSVYPNPMAETATIQLSAMPDPGTRFVLYDVTGKEISSMPVNSTSFTIARNGLASGMYFWKLQCAGESAASGRLSVL